MVARLCYDSGNAAHCNIGYQHFELVSTTILATSAKQSFALNGLTALKLS